jgi:hypothetical protein
MVNHFQAEMRTYLCVQIDKGVTQEWKYLYGMDAVLIFNQIPHEKILDSEMCILENICGLHMNHISISKAEPFI